MDGIAHPPQKNKRQEQHFPIPRMHGCFSFYYRSPLDSDYRYVHDFFCFPHHRSSRFLLARVLTRCIVFLDQSFLLMNGGGKGRFVMNEGGKGRRYCPFPWHF